ncbi:hypothetical protein P4S64_05270 [Vibrio sp. M60_M31a]
MDAPHSEKAATISISPFAQPGSLFSNEPAAKILLELASGWQVWQKP